MMGIIILYFSRLGFVELVGKHTDFLGGVRVRDMRYRVYISSQHNFLRNAALFGVAMISPCDLQSHTLIHYCVDDGR